MTENYSILKSFVDLDEAVQFLEAQLVEKAKQNWVLQDTSGIQFVNNQWRVGMGFFIDHDNLVLQPAITDLEGELLDIGYTDAE